MRKSDTLDVDDLARAEENAGVTRAFASGAPPAATPTPPLAGIASLIGPLPDDALPLVDLEREIIRRALAKCGGNKSKTAAYLGIPRHVLVYRLAKYGMP